VGEGPDRGGHHGGYREAFAKAREQVKDAGGAMAEVRFEHRTAYPPFKLPGDGPAMKHAKRAVESLGLKPIPLFSNGGLGANWFDKHGVPTVTIGAGQDEAHTVNEYVGLPELLNGCRLAVALATLEM
jgi:tripeptide aminopeptidase